MKILTKFVSGLTLLSSIISLSSPTYASYINQQAPAVQKDNELDLERLVDSIIQVESSGNPRAIGQAGEIGLGQLMPSRARELEARYKNLPRLGKTDEEVKRSLFNSDVNRAYVRAALQEYTRSYPGNLESAVAAYNSGLNSPRTANYQLMLSELTGRNLDYDGSIGPKTREAVKEFQSAHRLKVDGIMGDATKAKIMREYKDRLKKDPKSGIVPRNGITETYVRKVLWNYHTRR